MYTSTFSVRVNQPVNKGLPSWNDLDFFKEAIDGLGLFFLRIQ